jgi:outer membrane protein
LLEAALASHDAALQKTIANVIGLYFDLQTDHANRTAKEKNELLARQTLTIAQKREARGAGSQADTLQAITLLAKAELEHTRAQGIEEKSLVALIVALGLPIQMVETQNLTLAQGYQSDDATLKQDIASWLKLAREQHPALAAARTQLESIKQKLIATRSEGLPTLDFTQSKYINGRPDQGLTTMQTEESITGFTLTIPLFEGFAHTYQVRDVQAQIEIKEAELQDIQNQVLGEIAKAHADAVAALRNLTSSGHLLDAARAALDNVQRQYEQGVADMLAMLNVQQRLSMRSRNEFEHSRNGVLRGSDYSLMRV